MNTIQASDVKLTHKVLSKFSKIKIPKAHLPTLRAFTIYSGAFVVFVAAASYSYQLPNGTQVSSLFSTQASATDHDSSTDEAVALGIAGTMAMRANLPIAADIGNRSTDLYVQSMINRNGAGMIGKPYISNASAYSVINYTVKDGDTPQSIADQFGLTVQTIKWANDLNADTLTVGAEIKVLPVDGVLYTTKENDTIEAIADKYKSDAQQIIVFNDLELSGIKSDQQIIIPNGELPLEEQPDYVAPVSQNPITNTSAAPAAPASNGSGLVNGYSPIAMVASGNAYAFGNCTSWAYERRVQLGHPVGSYWGNGATWDSSARAAGYVVDKVPTVGAVMQMPAYVDAYTGAYGHVAIVESVNADGSVYISEMNYAGNFNVVTYRTVPAAQAALYNYIH